MMVDWFYWSWTILIGGIPLAALLYWKIQPSEERDKPRLRIGVLYGISLLSVYVMLVFVDRGVKHFGGSLTPSEAFRADPIASIGMVLLLGLVETLCILFFHSGYYKRIYES